MTDDPLPPRLGLWLIIGLASWFELAGIMATVWWLYGHL